MTKSEWVFNGPTYGQLRVARDQIVLGIPQTMKFWATILTWNFWLWLQQFLGEESKTERVINVTRIQFVKSPNGDFDECKITGWIDQPENTIVMFYNSRKRAGELKYD